MNARPDYAREIRESLVDPDAICSALGLLESSKKQPRGRIIRCPSHGEKNPSCSVRVGQDGTLGVKCFSCGFAGDVLTLIACVHGYDVRANFRDVLLEGARMANRWDIIDALKGNSEPRTAPRVQRVIAPLVEPELKDIRYFEIVEALLEACPLRQSPKVSAYLGVRGIFADADAAGVCGLPSDTGLLTKAMLERFSREELELASLLRKAYEAIDSRYGLLIPWRDRNGVVQCLQRRALGNEHPKYLSPRGRSPSSPFGIELLANALAFDGPNGEIVVTEGALDCLARRRIARHRGERCAVIGVYNATSFDVESWADLVRGRRVVLALDNDVAGENASAKLASSLDGIASEIVRERSHANDWGAAIEAAMHTARTGS